MTAYYNEFDPAAARWLRNLIDAGLIAKGVVDDRSIEDVRPSDLRGFTQCHFFAGIGVWSYALRQAEWPDSRQVWTGSCPCQPFSAAGSKDGFTDERHLWPAFHWLIQQCKPGVVFGEQVASKAAEPWLDLVQADMEAMGYAFGACAFPSAGVGAPHIRDRTSVTALTGWPTPSARDGKGGYLGGRIRNGKLSTDTLDVAAQLTAGGERLTDSGQLLTGSDAKTDIVAPLDPAHSRWLMGLPEEWDDCAGTATQSMQKQQGSSSKVTLNRGMDDLI